MTTCFVSAFVVPTQKVSAKVFRQRNYRRSLTKQLSKCRGRGMRRSNAVLGGRLHAKTEACAGAKSIHFEPTKTGPLVSLPLKRLGKNEKENLRARSQQRPTPRAPAEPDLARRQ